MAALREASRLGAHQLELDLRRTADGAIVLMHDPTVDRTTDGSGAVSQLSLSQLRRLDAGRGFDARFAGESIPTLEEVLDVLPRDIWLNLQIKQGEPIAARVVDLLARTERLDQAFLACGNSAAREARRAHPDALVCNLARQRSRDAYVEHAIATGSNFIQFHHLRGMPEPRQIERARGAGLRINFFCDPQATRVQELFERGVDFPLVDDLVAALEVAERLGIRPHAPA